MMHETFRQFANTVGEVLGTGWTFLVVLILIATSGLYFGFSEVWRVNVSTIVAVVSLLSLIILQTSQNHNDKATHLKLDELVKAVEGARDEVAEAEKEADENLEDLKD